MLLRKLREHTADDEQEHDEYDEDEEPRGRADEEDDEDEDYEDDEDEDDHGPRGHADEDDEEEDDEDEDEEDMPRGRAEDDEDEDEEEDEESDARASSRTRSHDDDGDDDRGFASTVWEAVVEGVRSSQGNREGKSSRARASGGGDDEDDVSDRTPRGQSGDGRRKARAPRGKGHSPERDRSDGGDGSSVVQQARRQLVELTGHEAESISGLERGDDGEVKVRCEVVELERIPHSTDVLATYELTLDRRGRLVDCSRVARYSRSSAEVGVR